MSDDSTTRLLHDALAAHEAGRLDDAEAAYRKLIGDNPANADALHLLGLVMDQRDQPDAAFDLIARAIAVSPATGVYHFNLGNVQRRRGRFDHALRAWRQAGLLAPELAGDAYSSVATLLAERAAAGKEIAAWHRAATAANNAWVLRNRIATEANPPSALLSAAARALSELAEALDGVGELEAAVEASGAASHFAPQDGLMHNTRGRLLMKAGRPGEAAEAMRLAVSLIPDNAPLLVNLAAALSTSGVRDLSESVAAVRRAIELNPNFVGAHELLATLLREAGRAGEAAITARHALLLTPNSARANDALGNALLDLGDADGACAAFRRAIQIAPHRATHSNLLMAMHYESRMDPDALHAEHLRWASTHAQSLIDARPDHSNDRNPDRRLRVGYISPDFRRHPVSVFFTPLLLNHGHGANGEFEIYLYNNTRLIDDVTDGFRERCDGWRDVVALTDEQTARLIENDRIDILVDLAGHTANNRLLTMARRPAPVQMTYIGYWNTTGLASIDYRLTDDWNDPAGGTTERFWIEKLLRIDGGAWCFHPPTARPEVSASPGARDGFVTFISINRLAKVTDAMLHMWRQILEQTRRARLIIVAGGDDRRVRAALKGVDPARYELIDRMKPDEYYRLFDRADVSLDVAPHNGHTTSVDALWQGLPVLTIAGQTHCGRLGASLLSSIDLRDFVCHSAADYVERAVALEEKIETLANIRATLRERMLGSPLTDGRRLARNVEAIYRNAWRRWVTD